MLSSSSRGVMDVVPITDFPDIRYPGFIEGEHGALMVLPRERNMTRIYVPFKPNTPEHHDRATIDLETIRCRAQTFFKGYTFNFKICEWWSVYQVGQRVSERSQNPSGRIFLAGDAVHMHSPKIGLGMNTSMQDGYNLGWKVALAAARAVRSPAELLATYEMERLPVAKTLVNFDRALWTNEGAMDPGEFQKTHEAFREFADGRKLMYPENLIISKTTGSQSAARKLIVGESFIHAKVLGHADSQLYWTTRLFQSDGRFRIVLMAGDIDAEEQFERVKHLCKRISAGGQADGRCNALVSRYPYPFEAPTLVNSMLRVRSSTFPIPYAAHLILITTAGTIVAFSSTQLATSIVTAMEALTTCGAWIGAGALLNRGCCLLT
ncbi:hypothetical protein KC321_g73 [Hortaea werneckii]|nr:hypothetical protein KC321_g73 [Hortaea werneckii]